MPTLILPVVWMVVEDGYVVAQIPVIPGCISQGRNKQEALANIKEATLLCLEIREQEGWDLPSDFSVEEVTFAV